MNNQETNDSDKAMTGNQSPWFSTSELLEYLGISKSDFKKQLTLFKEGIHYKYENPNNPDSQLLWRIDLIDEILCFPIPPLEKEAMLKAINNHIICQE